MTKPIETEADHQTALARIDALMDAEVRSVAEISLWPSLI